jgi:hypothetical protein
MRDVSWWYGYSVLYFIKLVRLIKIHLNETSSNVREGNYLSDTFPVQNAVK